MPDRYRATYFRNELGHGFECSGPGCGIRPLGFISSGWPTKKAAKERFEQHVTEHETGKPAPDQADLYEKHTGRRTRKGA